LTESNWLLCSIHFAFTIIIHFSFAATMSWISDDSIFYCCSWCWNIAIWLYLMLFGLQEQPWCFWSIILLLLCWYWGLFVHVNVCIVRYRSLFVLPYSWSIVFAHRKFPLICSRSNFVTFTFWPLFVPALRFWVFVVLDDTGLGWNAAALFCWRGWCTFHWASFSV